MIGIQAICEDTCLYCYHLVEARNKQDLDSWLVLEWTKHELALLKASIKLESVLYSWMKDYLSAVFGEGKDEQIMNWFLDEWSTGQKERLEHERAQTRKWMEQAALEATMGTVENVEAR